MIFWRRVYLTGAQADLIPLHSFGLFIKRGDGFIDIWRKKGG